MNRNSCAIIVGVLLTVSAACDDDSPTTPTGTAPVIYQDTNFRGDSRAVAADASDLELDGARTGAVAVHVVSGARGHGARHS